MTNDENFDKYDGENKWIRIYIYPNREKFLGGSHMTKEQHKTSNKRHKKSKMGGNQ